MAIICQCVGVRDRNIASVVRRGATDLSAVQAACGAATQCGGCESAVMALIDQHARPVSGCQASGAHAAFAGVHA